MRSIPDLQPELFRGVLTRRVFAFLIDLVVLSVPVILGYIFIAVFGVVTLGLGWALFWLVSPASVIWALVYYGASLGGPHSATIGMRVMDLELRTWYGAPGYFVLGAMHAVLFWVSVSFLTPLVLLVGLFNGRRRLLHDIILGTVVINSSVRSPVGAAGADLLIRDDRLANRLTVSLRGAMLDADCFGGRRHPVTQHSRDTPQFYLTAPSPCPYLPGRHERKVFTHLVGDKAGDLNDLLTHGGFRRSQSIAYRPACDQCRACVSVRVDRQRIPALAQFPQDPGAQRRHRRRAAQRGADLGAIFGVPRLSRPAPSPWRHGRHDRARLRDDGGGQPRRNPHHRIPPARHRQRHHRPRRGTDRGGADRRAQRRAVDGLFVLRAVARKAARSAPS